MRTRAAKVWLALLIALGGLLGGLIAASNAYANEVINTAASGPFEATPQIATQADELDMGEAIDEARRVERIGLAGRDLLPAWRWGDGAATGFYTNYTSDWQAAIKEVQYPITNGIGTLMFSIASMLWSLVLWLVWTAITTDLLSDAIRPINRGYRALGNALTNGFVVAIVVILGVIWAAWQGLKGGLGALARGVVATLLPIGLMLAMLTAAARPAGMGGDLGESDARVGSPGWIAVEGSEISTSLASGLAAGFVNSEALNHADDPDVLSCVRYRGALHYWFDQTVAGAWWKDLVRAVSLVWEESYLVAWRDAQFGRTGATTFNDEDSSSTAEAVDCRMLETRTHRVAEYQHILTAQGMRDAPNAVSALGMGPALAFGPSAGDEIITQGASGGAPFRSDSGPFSQWSGDAVGQSVTGWAICAADENGNWEIRPEFRDIRLVDGGFSLFGVGSSTTEINEGNTDCNAWWGADRGDNSVLIDIGDGRAPVTRLDVDESGSADLFVEYAEALHGFNGTEKIVLGLLSIVVAAAFLVSIGGLALGTILAQLAFAILLVLLPVILLFIAWPSDNSSHVARRILKVLLGTLAAKTIFILVLSGLVILISSTRVLLSDWASAPGITGAISSAAVPLAAIWVFRYLLKQMGLGNLLSFKGAVNMTASMSKYQNDGGGGMLGSRLRRSLDPTYRYSMSRRLLRAGAGGLGKAAGSLTGRNKDGSGRDGGPGAPLGDGGPGAPSPEVGSGEPGRPRGGEGAPVGAGALVGAGIGAGAVSAAGAPMGNGAMPAEESSFLGGGKARRSLSNWASDRVSGAKGRAKDAVAWTVGHAPHLAAGGVALVATGMAAPAAGLIGTAAGAVAGGGAAAVGTLTGASASTLGAHLVGAGVLGGTGWAARRGWQHVTAGSARMAGWIGSDGEQVTPLDQARTAERRGRTAEMGPPELPEGSPFPAGGTPMGPVPVLVPSGPFSTYSGGGAAAGGGGGGRGAGSTVHITNHVTNNVTNRHTHEHHRPTEIYKITQSKTDSTARPQRPSGGSGWGGGYQRRNDR